MHAAERMAERGITEEDLLAALAHRAGRARPASLGKIWIFGYAQRGRILKVLLTADETVVITAAWPDD